MKAEIVKADEKINEVIKANGIDEQGGALIVQTFSTFSQEYGPLKAQAGGIIIKSVEDTEEMQEARELRLKLRAIRTSADKERVRLKEKALRYNKTVQSVFNILEGDIKETEAALLEKEKFVQRMEEERLAKLKAEREIKAEPWAEFLPQIDLGNLTEEDFVLLLDGAKLRAKEAAEEAAREKERERVAQCTMERKAEAGIYREWIEDDMWNELGVLTEEEFENLVMFCKGKKAEKEKAEAKEAARVEKERKEVEKKRKEAEKVKADAEKKRAEAVKKMEEAAEVIRKSEAKLLKERKAKKEAKEKAEAEAKAEADRKASMSDWDTMEEVAAACERLSIPKLKNDEAEKCRVEVETLLKKVAAFIRTRKKINS